MRELKEVTTKSGFGKQTMKVSSYFADVEYDSETRTIYHISTGETIENFNTPLWKTASDEEIGECIDRIIKREKYFIMYGGIKKKMSDLINLGWANGWKETPQIVEECRKKKHYPSDVDHGPPNRGIEHVVVCKECGYIYRYDSSD
jgi:hypothetical protein